MKFGKNLQYLRMIYKNMTQEELASQLNVSRQTVSKWELGQGKPELNKIKEICRLFNCSSDKLLFGDMKITNAAYSDIELESPGSFCYIKYTVISVNPEEDAINKINMLADKLNIVNPKIIGWDFPFVSNEQINVYHMHGYTAALVLPADIKVEDKQLVIEKREAQHYVTIIIENPMSNPFHLISDAFKSLFQYININSYVYDNFSFEHEYEEKDIKYMKIYIAIK